MSRRRSRQLALEVLYQAEVGRFPLAEVLARVRGQRPREDWPFIAALAEGVTDRRRALDRAIRPHLRAWTLERLSAVDRIILRMGLFELQQGETPLPVVLDEAVALAKRYGGAASARFVNGVLGGVVRSAAPQGANRARGGTRERARTVRRARSRT